MKKQIETKGATVRESLERCDGLLVSLHSTRYDHLRKCQSSTRDTDLSNAESSRNQLSNTWNTSNITIGYSLGFKSKPKAKGYLML